MRNDPILMHYGVKGMRWRHRKSGIGAMEGVLNNPAAGGESKSNRYAPKSKVRKNETHYTNLRVKRLAQLHNKGISYPKVTKEDILEEDVIEEEKLEEKKLKEKTLKEKRLKEKTLKEDTAKGKTRSSNAIAKGAGVGLIKPNLSMKQKMDAKRDQGKYDLGPFKPKKKKGKL